MRVLREKCPLFFVRSSPENAIHCIKKMLKCTLFAPHNAYSALVFPNLANSFSA